MSKHEPAALPVGKTNNESSSSYSWFVCAYVCIISCSSSGRRHLLCVCFLEEPIAAQAGSQSGDPPPAAVKARSSCQRVSLVGGMVITLACLSKSCKILKRVAGEILSGNR